MLPQHCQNVENDLTTLSNIVKRDFGWTKWFQGFLLSGFNITLFIVHKNIILCKLTDWLAKQALFVIRKQRWANVTIVTKYTFWAPLFRTKGCGWLNVISLNYISDRNILYQILCKTIDCCFWFGCKNVLSLKIYGHWWPLSGENVNVNIYQHILVESKKIIYTDKVK